MLASDPVAMRILNQRTTLVIVRPHSRALPAGFPGSSVQSFPSAAAIRQAIASHSLVPGISGIAFDDEAWPLTPAAERAHPTQAVAAAATAVHRAGLAYLQFGNLPVDGSRMGGARWAEVIDIQAQGRERDSAIYAAYVKAQAAQARRFNPRVEVFAGLSTNPPGPAVTAQELYDDILATRAVVAGYWLNIPSPGAACPRCHAPAPDLAEQMFARLAVAAHAGAADQPSRYWIFAAAHLAQVAANPEADALLRAGALFEPLSPRQEPYRALSVIPTAVFHSYAALVQAVKDHTLPADTRAILYDNERFANTPKREQAEPSKFAALVAALAKAHGWVSICDFIPADRLPPTARAAANEVPGCDVIGLNTVQQSERVPAVYAAKVSSELRVIRTLRPQVPVLAGLSSNPAGSAVTSAELAADMRATWKEVSGYWLNVPAPGVGCPHCRPPQPEIMAQALAQAEPLLNTRS
jgi:hypothetical protein